MNRVFSILLGTLLLIGCTSTRKALDSWMGSTKQELISQWGPPDRTASDGGSGEILVYATQGYWPGYNGQGAFTYWDYKYMYLDSQGKVYHWVTKRERIPPTQVDLNIYKRY